MIGLELSVTCQRCKKEVTAEYNPDQQPSEVFEDWTVSRPIPVRRQRDRSDGLLDRIVKEAINERRPKHELMLCPDCSEGWRELHNTTLNEFIGPAVEAGAQ